MGLLCQHIKTCPWPSCDLDLLIYLLLSKLLFKTKDHSSNFWKHIVNLDDLDLLNFFTVVKFELLVLPTFCFLKLNCRVQFSILTLTFLPKSLFCSYVYKFCMILQGDFQPWTWLSVLEATFMKYIFFTLISTLTLADLVLIIFFLV